NDSYGSFFTPILPVLIEKLSLWMMRVGSALEVGPPPAGMDVPDLRPLLGAIVATPSHPRHLTKVFQVQQQLDAGTAILVNDAHTERCTIQPADPLSGPP